MSAIILDREIIHYEVLGRGKPVLFLHGWVGSWRYWIPVMQAASMTYRAYALDLWGYGDSTKNPERYTLKGQVQLLSSFLEEMGIMRLVIVGHGLGAIVGMIYARLNPGQVDRVMAVGLPMEESMMQPRLRSDPPAILADLLLGRLPATEPARVDAPKADPLAIQGAMASLGAVNLRDLWQNPASPVLLVHGTTDPVIQPPHNEHLAAMPEQMHAVTFDQSGHFPMLDETTKFNRLLFDFLSLASGESPRDLQLKEEWKRRVR
jgi:pimeloyl-ACP methyl ester carboxylesterase